MQLQILDFDHSASRQATLPDAAHWQRSSTLHLADLGPRLRLWARSASIAALQARLDASGATATGAISLLGSGDFHHIAAVLIGRAAAQAARPFTVLHFDNHPDWVRLAPRWHCGSWVNRVLAMPNVARVITLGVCSDDLVNPGRKGGNLPALGSGRLVLMPWRHAPSRAPRRLPDGPGHRWADGEIHWTELADGSFAVHLARILELVATDDIWITIDKDVLPEREVLSNWDQGQMPLARLVEAITFFVQRRRLIGADLCGEYSPPAHRNWFKRIEARMDQPARAVDAAALARNEAVNVALLRALAGPDA